MERSKRNYTRDITPPFNEFLPLHDKFILSPALRLRQHVAHVRFAWGILYPLPVSEALVSLPAQLFARHSHGVLVVGVRLLRKGLC